MSTRITNRGSHRLRGAGVSRMRRRQHTGRAHGSSHHGTRDGHGCAARPRRFLAEVRAAGLGNKDLTTATDSQLLNIGTDECGALSAANGNGIAGYSRLIDSLMKTARNRPHTRQRSCWTRPSGAFARRTATCPHLVHRDGLTAHAVDAPLASAGGRSQVLRGCGRRHGMSP